MRRAAVPAAIAAARRPRPAATSSTPSRRTGGRPPAAWTAWLLPAAILLHAWAALQHRFPDWRLAIVGPDWYGYTASMQALASRLGVRSVPVYAVLSCGVWIATLSSGVHATVAGVLVALVVPVRARIEQAEFLSVVRGRLADLEASDLRRESMARDRRQLEFIGDLHQASGAFLPPALALETALHPVTAYLVLPLFALFNAGVKLKGGVGAALASPVSLGFLYGLFVGKQVGITLASWRPSWT